ncbi:dihydrolipoamide acetyltransferase family protein [Bordetella sp. 15P40C-2]|uniref:dihydrolipoamide acetyltransferase family protein n=1 Tax=Bordetella sp. 15P40C-2 TaxID=2572246 RepID=UPI001924B8F4|nr:dihydrolipoamide acetyltransferase family protein [Bordetella sp. 15P40C-2]
MPKLGLTMTEGSIADWMVQPGQSIQKGQALFVVETDKVANEIPAEQSGTLLEIVVPVGTTVPVGTLIGVWDDGIAATGQETGEAPRATAEPTRSATADRAAPTSPNDAATSLHNRATEPQTGGRRVVATPLARRLANERGVSLHGVRGTGPKGRIVARDVPDQEAAEPLRGADVEADDAYTLIAATNLQTTIARRLTQGKQETPHFYLALDAEVSRLVALRKEINDAQPPVRLTLNHFIVMAVARALSDMPESNRVWSDNGILAFKRIDVGVAVSTDQGLMAPAVRDVGAVGIGELARRLDAVTAAARQGTLTSRDMGMPAITVSNAGMHNVTYMTSIINPGQAMILGVGSVKGVFRPDDAGQPVLRQEMGLVLSADHRIMDGVSALKFLNRIVDLLARPAQLLVN